MIKDEVLLWARMFRTGEFPLQGNCGGWNSLRVHCLQEIKKDKINVTLRRDKSILSIQKPVSKGMPA